MFLLAVFAQKVTRPYAGALFDDYGTVTRSYVCAPQRHGREAKYFQNTRMQQKHMKLCALGDLPEGAPRSPDFQGSSPGLGTRSASPDGHCIGWAGRVHPVTTWGLCLAPGLPGANSSSRHVPGSSSPPRS